MQHIKTLSFLDSLLGKSKTVSVSFSEEETKLYDVVSKMTSTEIKRAIGISDINELIRLAERDYRNISQTIKVLILQFLKNDNSFISSSDVTFRNSKDIPFQRWYPYIEGYSPNFVRTLIQHYVNEKCIIYEPFAGTGTTLFASDSLGYNTFYSEANPLLRFLIDTKLKVLKLSSNERLILSDGLNNIVPDLLQFSMPQKESLISDYTSAFGRSKYFPDENFCQILSTATFIDKIKNEVLSNLLKVAVLASLIPSSLLKKQGDLRFKTGKELKNGVEKFSDVFKRNISVIIEDLKNDKYKISMKHSCIIENAKLIGKCNFSKIGCVITSPPYLNGTNYVRNTKLELWFMGTLKSKQNLRILRDEMLTSGINDVKAEYIGNDQISGRSQLYDKTIAALKGHAYDKRIPIMAQSYFSEMFEIFNSLKEKLLDRSIILIDIGDSVFNNVHIKTDDILAELFENIGYTYNGKEKLRERRSRNGQILSQTLLKFTYGKL
nr:hypothetical protein [uncultured Prevotella sp.]